MTLLRQPLFNLRLIQRQLEVRPIPQAHAEILHGWADEISSQRITRQKETAIRRPFIERIFVQVLGYQAYGSGDRWQIHDEQGAGRGSMDCALGHFGPEGARVVAPFELKGPGTNNLDAIMPGRYKSPVQQAWEYANDTPGCRFVLVSNMLEIRLYAVGYGRQAFEVWNIVDLVNPAEYARFRLLLSANNLLTGRTASLLDNSAQADKEITNKLYRDYRALRISLIVSLLHTNPSLETTSVISRAQKLLDRVLFIAFAEDRGLLPDKTLESTFSASNPFHPQPIWENFKGLFSFIDKGNPARHIPAYNGGLFASDQDIDSLLVSDEICQQFQQLGTYDFASEVSVTVLGHIFEQSVADLEELRDAAEEGNFELKAKEQIERGTGRSVKGRRKEEGVVYTPDHVTAFIVEKALGGYLEGEFERMLSEYVRDPKNPRKPDGEVDWKPLTRNDPIRATLPRVGKRTRAGQFQGDVEARAYEYLFWRDWLERLKTVSVVDPACGSGAFLVAAFDWLQNEYARVNEHLQAITGSFDLFDLNKAILNGNLYGVDVNAESVEITKLSLWLKTAERGKPLTSLKANINLGNSLIRESEYSERGFDWQAAYPGVFASGGFDVVLGNPPYVRMERIKPIKPYLKRHYGDVAADRADLYAYFYELGVRVLLRDGGRLGYISSNSFMKTRSGEPLRRFLLGRTHLLAMVDFGDLQVFEGVTTYPIIVIAEKKIAGDQGSAELRYLVLEDKPKSLVATFEQESGVMPVEQLGAGSWQLENPALAALRRKLTEGHRTLKDVYGSPLYGIKTGLNAAFVLTRAERDYLTSIDPNSHTLLKPFLIGDDLKKWHVEPSDLWLINTPKGCVDIDDYPAIRDHLMQFRTLPDAKSDLERRATKQKWFELQQGAVGESGVFDRPKLIYPEISQGAKFSIDRSGAYLNKTVFSLPTDDAALLGLLSSRLAWFFFLGEANALRGGSWRVLMQQVYLEKVPVPVTLPGHERLAELSATCQTLCEQRMGIRNSFIRRIPDLAPGGAVKKLPGVLLRWWHLGFADFRREVKRTFKQDIPLAERSDWESFLDRERGSVVEIDDRIRRLEAEIDEVVYELFGLTSEEIALLEETLGFRLQENDSEDTDLAFVGTDQ